MVRYSKLPFRQLVSKYDCHITHTPMLLAKEFSRSAIARDSEFSTNNFERGTFWLDRPASSAMDGEEPGERRVTVPRKGRKIKGVLVAQFAANDGVQLADAVELVKPWVDGIDLNCGTSLPCRHSADPSRLSAKVVSHSRRIKKWTDGGRAFQEGIGCALLRKPETVRELVRAVKGRVGWAFPVSVKIRVDDDLSCVALRSQQVLIYQVDQRAHQQRDRSRRGRPHCARSHAASVVLWPSGRPGRDRFRRLMCQGASPCGG